MGRSKGWPACSSGPRPIASRPWCASTGTRSGSLRARPRPTSSTSTGTASVSAWASTIGSAARAATLCASWSIWPSPTSEPSTSVWPAPGVVFTRAPEREEWGGWVATFADPDGNVLQLMQLPVTARRVSAESPIESFVGRCPAGSARSGAPPTQRFGVPRLVEAGDAHALARLSGVDEAALTECRSRRDADDRRRRCRPAPGCRATPARQLGLLGGVAGSGRPPRVHVPDQT